MLFQFQLAHEGAIDACAECKLLLAEANLLPQFAKQGGEGVRQGVVSYTGHSLTVRHSRNIVHGKCAPENTHYWCDRRVQLKTRHASATAARADRRTHKVVAEEPSGGWDREKDFLDWASGVVLIALIKDRVLEGSVSQDGRFLFISPNIGAFDELAEHCPHISELWIMVADTVGRSASYVDRIVEVASWTAQTPGGRPLLVLRGQTGHLIGLDDDGPFTLRASSVHWSGEGRYQRAPTPANTSTSTV